MSSKLTGRKWNVPGNWYAPEKKLQEFPSVVRTELVDTTSSCGDWSGYFIQKIGNKYYTIMFYQENNYPDEGYILYTRPFESYVSDSIPTKDEINEIIFNN